MLSYFCIIWQFLSLYVIAVNNGCWKVYECSWNSWIRRKLQGVSSENDLSNDEYFISKGRLAILPLNNEGDRGTDEDLGDENELLPNNSNRFQLLAGAAVDLSTSREIFC